MDFAINENLAIATRCRQALEEKGIHPAALVKATNRSSATISRYLDGTLRIPLVVLAEISELTHKDLDWLVAGQWSSVPGQEPEHPDHAELINQANNRWAEVIAQEIKAGFNLLNAIIHAVDEQIQANSLPMDSARKGELIIKLYEIFSEQEDNQLDRAAVAEQIRLSS